MNRKEIIELICRQTNYTTEKAEELLNKNNDNYIKIIEEYLGVKNNNINNEVIKKSYTNTKFSIMRDKFDHYKNFN
jgi:hypothetical protein